MSQPKRRRGSLRLVLLGTACVVAGVLFDWGQLAPAIRGVAERVMPKQAAVTAPNAAPAIPVSAVAARTGDFSVRVTGLGTVQAYNTVLVRTRVDGEVMSINFQEGQIVRQGDLLVQIDPRPFQAALDGARAKKQQDTANLDNAKRDLARSQSLIQSNFVTRQTLDTQTANVAQLTAQVAADDAAIENDETMLSYATIHAPITGRVGFRLVDKGNIVNAASQTGIVEIDQIQPIAVIFTEPEDSLGAITEGLKGGPLDVAALSSDGAQTLADGKLETFNNTIDAATGTIKLKGAFANEDQRLWPGLSVSTKLKVSTLKNVVLVPVPAVQHGPNGLYAFVIGPDSKVSVRPITVNLSDDTDAVVAKGIAAGEQVVTGGQYRLQDHSLVKIMPETAPQTAARES